MEKSDLTPAAYTSKSTDVGSAETISEQEGAHGESAALGSLAATGNAGPNEQTTSLLGASSASRRGTTRTQAAYTLKLQRTQGNRAVAQMLQAARQPAPATTMSQTKGQPAASEEHISEQTPESQRTAAIPSSELPVQRSAQAHSPAERQTETPSHDSANQPASESPRALPAPNPSTAASIQRTSAAAPAPSATRPTAAPAQAAPNRNGSNAAQAAGGAAKLNVDASSSAGLIQSLTSAPPSAFGGAVETAFTRAPEIQQKEKTELQTSLPEIEKPTGLPRQGEKPAPKETVLQSGKLPATDPKGGRAGTPRPAQHKEARGPLPGNRVSTATREPASKDAQGGDGGWWNWLSNRVRSFIGSLPTKDPGLSTSAGARPRMDLSGEANPAQLAEQQRSSDREVATQHAEADTATQGYFGENDVFPTVPSEKLRSNHKLSATPDLKGGKLQVKAIPLEVMSGLDQNAASWLRGKTGEHTEKQKLDRAEYERQSKETRDEGQRQITEETAQVTAEQKGIQKQAQADVNAERTKWREENRKVQQDYALKTEAKRGEIDRQIQDKVQSTERDVDKTLTDAEQKADQERKKVEAEAEAKKREVENKPRSAWERFKGAVSSAFDEIKGAINGLFDTLRSVVKGIIEGAKALVNNLIDLARGAIVGLIKGFGEFAKGLVSVALVAFPGLAQKARQWIDGTVNKGIDGVNKAAEALKKATNKILDGIGSALDTILATYQKAFNLILDGLKLIAAALVEVMQKIGQLVEAAKQMPDHFQGQMQEELLGMDLTQPLPFERTNPVQTAAASPNASATTSDAAQAYAPEDAALLSRTSFTDSDVAVDSVAPMDLDPELIQSLNLRDGQEIEFGESSDPSRSLKAIQEELGGGAMAAAPGQATAGPEAAQATAVEDTDAQLEALMAQEPAGNVTEKKGDSAQQSDIPEEMKIGPLTQSQRAKYMFNQMWKGVKNWFSSNWPKLLVGAIAALVGGIALTVLTGGAILSALPPLMQIIGALMVGVAIARVSTYVGEYLSKGWAGEIGGAAKSLARGLAIGAIELIFALLFNIGAVVKSLKAGLKPSLKAAARSGKTLVTTTTKNVKALGQIGKQGIQTSIKNGKFVMQGLRAGFAKGAHSLDDLAKRLWERLRFRKFKIRLQGQRFQLLGFINPWVLLADGTIIKKNGGNGRPEVGKSVKVGRNQKGFIIGVVDDNASLTVQELKQLSQSERKALYKQFRASSQNDIRKALLNKESTTALRRGILIQPKGFQAHHIVPREIQKQKPIKDFLDEIGFDFEDGARNGIMLPPTDELRQAHSAWKNATLHFTSHASYTQRVASRIEQLRNSYRSTIAKGKPAAQAKKQIAQELDNYLEGLKSDLMDGSVKLD